ncbi:MAG TPA: multicopper oxidase domain-containing protein [Steroidobacteraceae bacterium]|jgi:FtsP/CotA-like multicopper oxidase with cupredoxin domain
MKFSTTDIIMSSARIFLIGAAAAGSLAASNSALGAVHGITGGASNPTFRLTASEASISQPDGADIYSWGYGCTSPPAGFAPTASADSAACPSMQMPGPTMIVTEGDYVTVILTNALPKAAGRTSIVFPGFSVAATNGVDGLLTKEAANGSSGNTVTYQFKASKPGTYAYYSGSQTDVQIEMGLFGAIVVLPSSASASSAACSHNLGTYSLAKSAYAIKDSCYDREYLFQFSELSSQIHEQVKAHVDACNNGSALVCPMISVATEPYVPNYYLVNGRSMPDDMEVNYSPTFPHQPYNGNPHMHPGELLLMRVIGQGRWQHPFHFHGNHARMIARDANLLVSKTDPSKSAGPLLFTISTVSGQTADAIFTWTGQGLNWDVYGTQPHTCKAKALPTVPGDTSAQSAGFDPVTHEYCGDHGKPIPVTPADPSIVVNGQWYAGTPYLGLQGVGNQTPEAPGTLNQNPQGGYAYMWHSHNEREITTNDVFPGGMMMMLLIDPITFDIDETN